ncbi:MAG: hypothetical protein MJ247_03560 [Alphaproteobacteria bacterium]|nr:hypothetical protein [Alphaproteobacteria bacterium]
MAFIYVYFSIIIVVGVTAFILHKFPPKWLQKNEEFFQAEGLTDADRANANRIAYEHFKFFVLQDGFRNHLVELFVDYYISHDNKKVLKKIKHYSDYENKVKNYLLAMPPKDRPVQSFVMDADSYFINGLVKYINTELAESDAKMDTIRSDLEDHKDTLLSKFKECFYIDEYGLRSFDKDKWQKEILYFINNVLSIDASALVVTKVLLEDDTVIEDSVDDEKPELETKEPEKALEASKEKAEDKKDKK